MENNLKKYEDDLKDLIEKGQLICWALQKVSRPEEFEETYKSSLGAAEYKKFSEKIPSFQNAYQNWYSEAQLVIKQLLPDRLNDFTKLYERPKTSRKEITHANYTIEDALFGLTVTRGWEKEVVVDQTAAILPLQQQLAILKSVERRFESTLLDIKQLTQAEVLDSELDAAKELLKNGYARAAGAIAGVVLEAHLGQVLINHKIKSTKKNPSISDFNDLLKKEGIIEAKEWRKIQHLGDLRNLCGHKKTKDPTEEDVNELISGAEKITKNLF